MSSSLKILYLVHDLADPAVLKRIKMFEDGGAVVTIGGFRRASCVPSSIKHLKYLDFGQTYNGGFTRRIVSVLKVLFSIKKHADFFKSCDVVVARNLEMLAIAHKGINLVDGSSKPLFYECLDIHRIMLRKDSIGKVMRWIEKSLCTKVRGLITSSPAFIREYFEPYLRMPVPMILIENKVYDPNDDIGTANSFGQSSMQTLVPASPWIIGWFGSIRCAKSLATLVQLTKKYKGAVRVVIRGRVSCDRMPDFEDVIASNAHITFEGPYKNPDDLQSIYSQVHFAWAVDMYQEGLNSSLLLPNRIYESCLYAAVPIALNYVETGRYLERLGVGALIGKPIQADLDNFFETLNSKKYEDFKTKIQHLDTSCWRYSKQDVRDFVNQLRPTTCNG